MAWEALVNVTASSGMPEKPLTPTETLLIAKGKTEGQSYCRGERTPVSESPWAPAVSPKEIYSNENKGQQLPVLGVLLVDEVIFLFDWTHFFWASHLVPVANRQQTLNELEWFDVEGAANLEFLGPALGSAPLGICFLSCHFREMAPVIDKDPSRIPICQLSKLWSNWPRVLMC